MLFDTNYPIASSIRPLLYTPFYISNELRDSLIATAKQAERENRESTKAGKKLQGEEKRKKPFLDKLISFGEGIMDSEERGLIVRAYEDLINAVGGREYFFDHQLYSPTLDSFRHEEMMVNDYENPALLLVEELEERGFGIDLFRTAAPSGGYRKTVDGLDDCIVVLADNKAMDALSKFRFGAMHILNELYRARGVLFGSYISHLFSERGKLHSDWEESGFSEEERNMLLVFALQRIIAIERNNHALEGKRLDSSKDEYWQDLRRKTEKLGVEPADQIFLRRIIRRLVEKELA